jgi:hypothetical protein
MRNPKLKKRISGYADITTWNNTAQDLNDRLLSGKFEVILRFLRFQELHTTL